MGNVSHVDAGCVRFSPLTSMLFWIFLIIRRSLFSCIVVLLLLLKPQCFYFIMCCGQAQWVFLWAEACCCFFLLMLWEINGSKVNLKLSPTPLVSVSWYTSWIYIFKVSDSGWFSVGLAVRASGPSQIERTCLRDESHSTLCKYPLISDNHFWLRTAMPGPGFSRVQQLFNKTPA